TAIPRLVVKRERSLLEDVEDLANLLLADDLTETYCTGIRDRNHDLAVGVEDAKDVEALARASNVLLLNLDDLGHPLSGINGLVPNLELDLGTCLHSVSLRRVVARALPERSKISKSTARAW